MRVRSPTVREGCVVDAALPDGRASDTFHGLIFSGGLSVRRGDSCSKSAQRKTYSVAFTSFSPYLKWTIPSCFCEVRTQKAADHSLLRPVLTTRLLARLS